MLNFKDWKLASSDGSKATLRHAKGHEMTIAVKALPKIQREQIARLAKVQTFDEGSPETVQPDHSDSSDKPTGQPPAPAASITINAAPAQTPTLAPAQNPAASYGAKPVEVTAPQIPSAIKNLGNNGTMNPEAVAKNSQEAVRGQQNIDVAKSAAAVPLEQGYLHGVSENQANAQALYNQMQQHVDDFGQYVRKNPINPNAYIENMGAGKKVLSGLGLILGGLGAGQLGSTDNPALRFLNQQIDRDIQGQQGKVNNQRTVLGAYQDLYGQGVAANNLTKASLLDIYTHKAQLIADKLGTPQARVAAQQLGANAAIEKSKLLQDAAVNLANLPGTHSTSSDMEARNVPRGTPGAPNKKGGLTTEELQAMHQKQNGEEMPAGISPKSPSEEESITSTAIEPILHRGSERLYQGLQYTPKARDQMAEITRQYTQAQQADKQLSQINGVFGNLIKGTKGGYLSGLSGRVHRTLNPHALAGLGTLVGGGVGLLGGPAGAAAGAGVGASVGEALGQGASALTNTDVNRLYDSNKTALLGALSSALKGTNVGDSSIHDVVEKNSPEYGDSVKTLQQKHDNIEHFIKSHVETSLLKTWHLSSD